MDAALSILVTSEGPGLVPRPQPSSRGCPLWDPLPDTLPSPNRTRSAGLQVLLHFKVFIESVTMTASVLSYGFFGHKTWDLSSPTRDRAWTWAPCIGRWSLNHWTTREVPRLSHLSRCVWFPVYPSTALNRQKAARPRVGRDPGFQLWHLRQSRHISAHTSTPGVWGHLIPSSQSLWLLVKPLLPSRYHLLAFRNSLVLQPSLLLY